MRDTHGGTQPGGIPTGVTCPKGVNPRVLHVRKVLTHGCTYQEGIPTGVHTRRGYPRALTVREVYPTGVTCPRGVPHGCVQGGIPTGVYKEVYPRVCYT